ncbi:phage tail protein [Citrobacter freundii]|uniref:phage tail protein n=1 Tax=Citrobacter freundii TaxID=546 RepID=UPI0030D068F2
MSKKFKTIITTDGAEKLAAATVPGGKKVNLTAMAVGDGGGTLPEPDAGQTKLINEVWRHALNKISQDNKNKNYIVAELVIPPDVGGFWMRELGLYDDAGTLIAVANMAESYKPKLAEGSGRAQTCRMVIIVSNVDSVELSIDATTVMATQDYVDDKLAEHEQSRNHPDATLKEKGFVQLSSATDSASEALAATPKAVKAAYDLASGKYTAQDASTAQKGIVKLSSATDSTSELLAATSKAVKIAMDNANARLAKERNGADIPNPSLFVQNIGLQDTVNKAAGALQKDQNLNDLPDKVLARKALQLGSASTLDATTSKIDNTSGRVLKVGDFGLGAQTYGVIPDSRMVSERAGYGVSFSRVYKSPDAPRMDTYYNLLMLPDTLNGAFSALAMSNNETPLYRAYGVGSSNSIIWVKLYDEKNKPTPADIGALPTSGGKVTGPLEIESTSPTLQLTETDTGKKYFIVVDNGNIRLNQETLAGVNGILSFDATTKDWTLPAGVIPKNYDNFLSLFQKINQASLATNGWFKDTNTGLIIQYGIGGGEGAAKNYPIQFPIAFPNRCINIQVTLQSASWDANSGSAMGQIIDNTLAYCWSTHSFFWFAIGR